MHVLFKRRRTRWGKIERAVRGFLVPDYLRKEASDRLLAESIENIVEFDKFKGSEWLNDMTPGFHWSTMVRLIPLEIFVVYGLFDNDYY